MKREKDMKEFFKNHKANSVIYACALVVAIVLVILYFVVDTLPETWKTVIVSFGVSVISSVLLAFLIEFSNDSRERRRIAKIRESKFAGLKMAVESFAERYCNIIMRCYRKWDIDGEPISGKEFSFSEWKEKGERLFREFNEGKGGSRTTELNDILALFKDILFDRISVVENIILSYESLFPFWELGGYFCEDEIKSIRTAALQCLNPQNELAYYHLGSEYFDYVSFHDGLMQIFDALFAIPEFSEIKDKKFKEG